MSLKMIGVLFILLFPKFTGLCVNIPSAWLHTAGVVFVFDGLPAGTAMIDRNTGGILPVLQCVTDRIPE